MRRRDLTPTYFLFHWGVKSHRLMGLSSFPFHGIGRKERETGRRLSRPSEATSGQHFFPDLFLGRDHTRLSGFMGHGYLDLFLLSVAHDPQPSEFVTVFLERQLVIPSFFHFLKRERKKEERNHQPGLSSGYKRFPLPFL